MRCSRHRSRTRHPADNTRSHNSAVCSADRSAEDNPATPSLPPPPSSTSSSSTSFPPTGTPSGPTAAEELSRQTCRHGARECRKRHDENPDGATCPPRSPRSELELLFRKHPPRWRTPGSDRSSDSQARRSSRHLLTVASQARYRPSAFLTAFVPAHRCGAAPESHRVPLTDGWALGRGRVTAQTDCSTTRHLRRAITTRPAAMGSSATASPPPQPEAFRTGVGTQRPFVHARPRSQSLEDRHGSPISFSSDVMSGPPMPTDASGIEASRAKA